MYMFKSFIEKVVMSFTKLFAFANEFWIFPQSLIMSAILWILWKPYYLENKEDKRYIISTTIFFTFNSKLIKWMSMWHIFEYNKKILVFRMFHAPFSWDTFSPKFMSFQIPFKKCSGIVLMHKQYRKICFIFICFKNVYN